MKFNKSKYRKGVSVVEVCMVTAVVVIVVALMKGGIEYIGGFSKQRELMQVQRDEQITLYQVARDVRNSVGIVDLSTYTLVLLVNDNRRGYDVDKSPDFFKEIHIGTVTYQYNSDSSGSYLLRKAEFNNVDNSGNVTSVYKVERKLIENLLQPEDPSTPGIDQMFKPFPEGTSAPFRGVTVVFRFGGNFLNRTPKTYKVDVLMRSMNEEI
jgi:hypothetical protein